MGDHGRPHGTFSLAGFAAAVPCDALEDPVGPPLAAAGGRFAVSLGAFAIATWRLSR
jgi:hypothetical protein